MRHLSLSHIQEGEPLEKREEEEPDPAQQTSNSNALDGLFWIRRTHCVFPRNLPAHLSGYWSMKIYPTCNTLLCIFYCAKETQVVSASSEELSSLPLLWAGGFPSSKQQQAWKSLLWSDPLVPFCFFPLIASMSWRLWKTKKMQQKRWIVFNDSIFQSGVITFFFFLLTLIPNWFSWRLKVLKKKKKKESNMDDILGMSLKGRRMVTILISPESLDKIKMSLMVGSYY